MEGSSFPAAFPSFVPFQPDEDFIRAAHFIFRGDEKLAEDENMPAHPRDLIKSLDPTSQSHFLDILSRFNKVLVIERLDQLITLKEQVLTQKNEVLQRALANVFRAEISLNCPPRKYMNEVSSLGLMEVPYENCLKDAYDFIKDCLVNVADMKFTLKTDLTHSEEAAFSILCETLTANSSKYERYMMNLSMLRLNAARTSQLAKTFKKILDNRTRRVTLGIYLNGADIASEEFKEFLDSKIFQHRNLSGLHLSIPR